MMATDEEWSDYTDTMLNGKLTGNAEHAREIRRTPLTATSILGMVLKNLQYAHDPYYQALWRPVEMRIAEFDDLVEVTQASRKRVILLAGKCGHHFDANCTSCNAALESANREIVNLHDQIAALKERLREAKRVMVKAVVPLEAINISSADMHCLEVREGIRSGISAVRAFLQENPDA